MPWRGLWWLVVDCHSARRAERTLSELPLPLISVVCLHQSVTYFKDRMLWVLPRAVVCFVVFRLGQNCKHRLCRIYPSRSSCSSNCRTFPAPTRRPYCVGPISRFSFVFTPSYTQYRSGYSEGIVSTRNNIINHISALWNPSAVVWLCRPLKQTMKISANLHSERRLFGYDIVRLLGNYQSFGRIFRRRCRWLVPPKRWQPSTRIHVIFMKDRFLGEGSMQQGKKFVTAFCNNAYEHWMRIEKVRTVYCLSNRDNR